MNTGTKLHETQAGRSNWTADAGGMGTGPIPVEPFVSPEYFNREREAIFKTCWINVGRVEDVPEPGDFFVQDLVVCETSLLIVRGKDAIVRAFHNVCQHRGNQIVWQERGRCRNTFTCRFHGWSYATDGRLVRVPDEQNFFDLDKAERGMVEIATEVWRGFIFVNLTDSPARSLEEYLGGAGEALARYPFETLPLYHQYRPEINVNWKVLIDAQQEGYHVPILHRASLGPSVATLAGGVYRSHSFESYGPHRRSSTPGNPDFVPNPTAALTAKYGAGVVDGFAGESVAAATEAEVMHGIFDLYVLFPNFVILTLYGTYYTYNIWPLAADRSIWDVRIYYTEPKNAADMFTLEYARVSLRDVLLEDASIHEHVQAGLKSGALKSIMFQDEEVACRHAYKIVNEYVGSVG